MLFSLVPTGGLPMLATAGCALAISVLLVMTQSHHGWLTFDMTAGVQKAHVRPTPRVGGVGIYLSLWLAWLLVGHHEVREILTVILLAGAAPLAAGLMEDVTKQVGVMPRLAATIAGGLFACLQSGVHVTRLEVFGLDSLMAAAPVGVTFTALAVGGIANAFNIIDGFHGLASGTAIICVLAFAAISVQVGDVPLALTCVLLCAAVIGFWLVNYPWGRLFMGDGGAYFLGFALAWIAVLLPMRNPAVSVWASFLVCVYPVTEVLYSVARRFRSRRSAGAPDSEHLHSLIQENVVRKRLSRAGENAANAAVSPIVWAFPALSAVLAAKFFDSAAVAGLASLACMVLYHLVYRHVASLGRVAGIGDPGMGKQNTRKNSAEFGGSRKAASLSHAHVQPAVRRRDRHARTGRDRIAR